MKLIRFAANGRIHNGTYRDGTILDEQGHAYKEEAIIWLPPVIPPKAVGLALNYADHAAELKMTMPEAPALFIKVNSSLIGHRAPVVYPTGAEYMHYEGELVVVMGRGGRKIKAENAWDYVKGYTVGNDVTVRDFVLNFYRPPVKAKGFDTFGPLGPWITTADEVGDPTNLAVKTYVNGELRQEGNTSQLIHTIPAIIEYVSEFMSFEENDLIWTGTPKGISPIHPGDVVRIEIERIGTLENPIVSEE